MKYKLSFALLLFLMAAFCDLSAQNAPKTMKVLTFNIRYDSPKDIGNLWKDRRHKVADLINFHQADLIGIQEGLHHQVLELDSLLPNFAWIGVGRDDGKKAGEYMAIFYKKDRLELQNHGHFWLSEQPTVPGSMSWETACTRMVTYAQFYDKVAKKSFFHYNTHLDHKSEKAQYQGAKLLVDSLQHSDSKDLVILTGDFNVLDTTDTYQVLTDSLKDTRSLCQQPYGPVYTFIGFDEPIEEDNKIDYIFLKNEEQVKVLRHGTLSDNWNGKYPSDHLPVLVELQWKNTTNE